MTGARVDKYAEWKEPSFQVDIFERPIPEPDHDEDDDPEWAEALDAVGLGVDDWEWEAAHDAARLAWTLPQLEWLFSRVGRHTTPTLLLSALYEGSLPGAARAGAAAYVWSLCEWPEHALDRNKWVAVWDLVGYSVAGQPAPRPTAPTTLYRGAVDDEVAELGLSWTRSRKVAEGFAAGGPQFGFGPGVVLECAFPPACLLADIGDAGRGGEHEVVADVRRGSPRPEPTRTPYAPG